MLIAHAPMGYIVAKKLGYEEKPFVLSSMIFAVLPDLDLLYYYGFDKTKTFHQLYFPHMPMICLGSFIVLRVTLELFKKESTRIRPYFIFSILIGRFTYYWIL